MTGPVTYLEIGLLVVLYFWVIREKLARQLFLMGWTILFWLLASLLAAKGSFLSGIFAAGLAACIWTGKTADLVTDIIFRIVDSYYTYTYRHDETPILTLARYAQRGKDKKTIRLAKRLKQSGEYNPLVLDAFIARAEPPQEKPYEPTLYKLKAEYLETPKKQRRE